MGWFGNITWQEGIVQKGNWLNLSEVSEKFHVKNMKLFVSLCIDNNNSVVFLLNLLSVNFLVVF